MPDIDGSTSLHKSRARPNAAETTGGVETSALVLKQHPPNAAVRIRVEVAFVSRFFILLMVVALPLKPQVAASLAQLTGTVRDPAGALIVGTGVTLRETGANRSYATQSGAGGRYWLAGLQSSSYALSVAGAGFAIGTRSGISLSVGQTVTIDMTLQVFSHEEQIVANEEAPAVEPARSEISQVVDMQQIEALPISGRLFTDFVLLTPGVATGRTGLQSTITEFDVTGISFGGTRDPSNEVTVDGADDINTISGSQRAIPSQEAVAEFRVVNNSFGAEYARALGGFVNVVTKSGSNSAHGSAYDPSAKGL
jgi:hypothetical protein